MGTRFHKKKNKIALLLCSGAAFLAGAGLISFFGRQYCMGVPVIQEEELDGYTETEELDITCLTFEDREAALDLQSGTVYISQPQEKLAHFYTLHGKLDSSLSEYSLYFLHTPAMDDIPDSVRDGEGLTLAVVKGTSFRRVNVVLTTLPVMLLDIEATYEDEQERHIVAGELILWNGGGEEDEGYRTMESRAEWHLRGNSTKIYPKQSWKLNLKKSDGENHDLNLCGLGSDDDWILNPMSMDDTKIKEKLTQEVWNRMASDSGYNDKMSEGSYVELVINGAYQGLYLMQRRIDTKYLELDKNADILMKGRNLWETESVYEAYEVISTPLNEEQTYSELEKALSAEGENRINTDNFTDVSLLLQLISGADNAGYKNMYYVLRRTDDGYELSFVPWDTDLSFGVTWGYSYEESLNEMIERRELQTVRTLMPDIDTQMAERWESLRDSFYSEETLFTICESIMDDLLSSGALQRDQDRWGTLHGGADNWENLQKFIRERLELLDHYYSGF